MGGAGRVDRQRYTVCPGNISHFFKREDGDAWVAQGLAPDQPGIRLDCPNKLQNPRISYSH